MKNILIFFSALILTTACSWHLRGSVATPKDLGNLYVSAIDSKGALISELRQQLKANRVALTDNAAAADYSLNIVDESKDKRTAGVGGDALSSAYEITLKANYEIILKNNSHPIKAVAISVRSFNYNTASINSATQEESMLEQEMRRDVAQQMLRRLNAVISHPPVDKSKKGGKANGQTAP